GYQAARPDGGPLRAGPEERGGGGEDHRPPDELLGRRLAAAEAQPLRGRGGGRDPARPRPRRGGPVAHPLHPDRAGPRAAVPGALALRLLVRHRRVRAQHVRQGLGGHQDLPVHRGPRDHPGHRARDDLRGHLRLLRRPGRQHHAAHRRDPGGHPDPRGCRAYHARPEARHPLAHHRHRAYRVDDRGPAYPGPGAGAQGARVLPGLALTGGRHVPPDLEAPAAERLLHRDHHAHVHGANGGLFRGGPELYRARHPAAERLFGGAYQRRRRPDEAHPAPAHLPGHCAEFADGGLQAPRRRPARRARPKDEEV
ncbi:MAG: Oligopeptide transport system permease protein OppC, partial [uncultured Rubrobacteraceae bacterium]